MNDFITTEKCVKHLRKVAPKAKTFYVHRETDLNGKHPFNEAELKVLAPEEDTSTYYLGVQAQALGVDKAGARAGRPSLTTMAPPAGVDAGAFYQLVKSRRRSYVDGLLSIDKAKNNTSVVLLIGTYLF